MDHITLIFIFLILVIILLIMLVYFYLHQTLKVALGSLISILGGFVALLFSPSADGSATVNLQLGNFGSITDQYIKVNVPTPVELYYITFITLGILIAWTMYLVHKRKNV